MTFEEAKALAAKNVHVRPQTSGRLAGKIAIVTGAAQGFGYGIAKEMLAQGALTSNQGDHTGLTDRKISYRHKNKLLSQE